MAVRQAVLERRSARDEHDADASQAAEASQALSDTPLSIPEDYNTQTQSQSQGMESVGSLPDVVKNFLDMFD